MENNEITNNYAGYAKHAALLGPVLWTLMILQKFPYKSDALAGYLPPILFVFALIPVAMLLQGRILKALKKEAQPVERDLRRCLSFLTGSGVIAVGELLTKLVIDKNLAGFRISNFTLIFFIVSLLFLLRAGLLKLTYEIGKGGWAETAWKCAAGYTDSIFIMAAGGILIKFPQASPIRLIIFAVVIAAFRITWAYVPEDRLYVVREFIQFLGERKLWWMAPIFIMMAFLMVLVMFAQTTGGSFPFIYAIF